MGKWPDRGRDSEEAMMTDSEVLVRLTLNSRHFSYTFLKKSTFRFDKVKCQVKTKTTTKQTRQKLGAQFQEKYFLNL